MRRATLDGLLAALRDGRGVALATDLATGEQRLLDPASSRAAREALQREQCADVEEGGRRWFVAPYGPPLRMILVGAVHIAQPLAAMAALAGYRVTIVDPRRAFATAERFAGVTLLDAWPDEALEALAPDERTAVVTLTHDPKLDDPALVAALRSRAFYVGSLGSRRTHAGRLARLRQQGLEEEVLARIHGPVGLDVGARTPAEIAVSILAQVTACLRGGAG